MIRNCGYQVTKIDSGENILENTLSMSVLEWEFRRNGCNIYGTKELESRESRNSLVGL